jgi:hypothetical protein
VASNSAAPHAKIGTFDPGRVCTRRIRGCGVGDQGADGSAVDGQGCRDAALVPHANGDVRVPEGLSPARQRRALRRFKGAEFVSDLYDLRESLRSVVPTSESEEQADWAQVAELLGRPAADEHATELHPRRATADGRARRATFRKWLYEHTPLVYAALYDDPLLERRRRAQLARLARVRRAALAYCIECHNPLIATELGFQFCPYQRAGQHEKLRRALFQFKPPATVFALGPKAARWHRHSRL